MSSQPQSYSIIFDAYVDYADEQIEIGYGITKNASGSGYVAASTAALAASHSGVNHGVALTTGPLGQTFRYQCDGIVGAASLPFVGTGSIENAVIASDGKVMRESATTGIVIGQCDLEGNVALQPPGSVLANLAGDVTGSPLATTVERILGAAVGALAGNVGKALVLTSATTFGFAVYGSATSGYDTADHAGGGQEVLSATGSGGLFTVRDGTSQRFGSSGVASAGTIRSKNASSWEYRDHADAADLNVASTFWDGTHNAVVFGDLTADTYVSGGAFQIAMTGYGSGPSISGAAGVAVPVYLGSDGSATTIRSASGVPTAGDNNGSVCFRRDASSASDFLYGRIGGAWVAIGGGSSSGVTWATDLAGSTDTSQAVIGLTGTSNATTIRSTSKSLEWVEGTATPKLWQATRTTDAAAQTLTVAAQSAYASAATNTSGGILYLYSGKGKTSAGDADVIVGANAGATYAQFANPSSGTGVLTLYGSNAAAIAFGSGAASVGQARFKNNVLAGTARNAAGSGDVALFMVDSSNNVLFGDGARVGYYYGSTVILRGTSAELARADTQGILCPNDIRLGTVSAYTALWLQTATPSTTNYAIRVSNDTFINARSGYIGEFCVADVGVGGWTSAVVWVQNGINLSLGTAFPTMNSATNTIYLSNGAAPSAAPSSGVYLLSNVGRFHIRSSNDPAGGPVPVNLIIDSVQDATNYTQNDQDIKIVVDVPGSSAQTRWIKTYTAS